MNGDNRKRIRVLVVLAGSSNPQLSVPACHHHAYFAQNGGSI